MERQPPAAQLNQPPVARLNQQPPAAQLNHQMLAAQLALVLCLGQEQSTLAALRLNQADPPVAVRLNQQPLAVAERSSNH